MTLPKPAANAGDPAYDVQTPGAIAPLACANHPKRETYVRCSSCGKPICTDCMVYSPVGIKCKECARLPRSARLVFGPDRWIRSIAAATAGGAVVGSFYYLLLSAVGFFFLAFLIGAGVGYVMGELVLRAAKHHRGVEPAAIAVAGTVWAFIFPPVLSAALRFGLSLDAVLFGFSRGAVVNWLVMAVAGYFAWQRVR
ncbi:MAG: B-box zinc finger protein [Thioalkalivibrio sp.]|nr:B-box zinc finger protein [Thioalkalivibrio sp.]